MSKKKKPAKTFAQRAKDIQKEFKDLDDAISKRTMMDKLSKLKDEQEAAKQVMQDAANQRRSISQGQNQMFNGGNIYDPPGSDNFNQGGYNASTGEYELSDYERDAQIRNSIINEQNDPLRIANQIPSKELSPYGVQSINLESMRNYREMPEQRDVDSSRRMINQMNTIEQSTDDTASSFSNFNKKFEDPRYSTLIPRMAPMINNAINLATAKRPDVADPSINLLDKSNLMPKERYAEQSARRGVMARGNTQRANLAERATSIEDLARLYQVGDSRENSALMDVASASNQFNVQHRGAEAQQAAQYDMYNAQVMDRRINEYRSNIADANNALTDFKRSEGATMAQSVAGLGTESFNAMTSDKYVDSTNKTLLLAAMEKGYLTEAEKRKFGYSKRGMADLKANRYAE